MAGKAEYEVFKDHAGEWRWRLKAANGEIVSTSEAYRSKAHAERGVYDAQETSRKAWGDNDAK